MRVLVKNVALPKMQRKQKHIVAVGGLFISLLSSETQLFQQRDGFLFDNPITESEVLLAIMHVLTDYFIRAINVIEIHVVEALDVRLNIARNGDVDEKQGAIPAH